IELEVFISTDVDPKAASIILPNFPRFSQWVLESINDKPEGGKYRIQVLGLKSHEGDPSLLTTTVSVNLPLLHQEIERDFRAKFSDANGVATLSAVALPHPTAAIE